MSPPPSDSEFDPARYQVPSVTRAMRVLEYLAGEGKDRSAAEVAAGLKLPHNSVFRIFLTLHAAGYVERCEDTKLYRLSRKLLGLGYQAVAGEGLIEKAAVPMRNLRDETGETALIGVLNGHRGVVLEQYPATHPVKVTVAIGHSFPLHSAAPAKAMLAHLRRDDCEAILHGMDFPKFTPRTITSRARFRDELERVREQGYALDLGEEMDEIRCVAAPVMDQRGEPVAAIWITGPHYRMEDEMLTESAPRVVGAAQQISEKLGHSVTLRVADSA